MLKIYNTLTRTKEEFKPITPHKVNFYACGITVYDFCHIGHARSLIIFDVIVRYLRYLKYNVKFVRNFTDIDDKIIKRANENQEDFQELTSRFIAAMHEDCEELGLLPPDEEPRATQFMPQIIQMVQTLVDKGYAYVGANGDVYYDISKFENYGKLSNRNIEQLQAGARVELSDAKKNPLDFVLWKLAKPDEPSWDSPWGKGRPGWHIECSAMSTHCLAEHFDIHAGGQDLVFPHHENEIAQAEAATGEKFANYWIHTGLLQVDGQKMSKSLGNFFTIRDVLQKFSPEVLRYFMITSNYRSPLNYSETDMVNARHALERLYTSLRDFSSAELEAAPDSEQGNQAFVSAMNDDFNTPEALAVLFDLSHQINKLRDSDKVEAGQLAKQLKKLGGILGILQKDPAQFLQSIIGEEIDTAEIEQLIKARNDARKNKNWAEADRIRDELDQIGVVLEDKSSGTIWRRK
ncbi:MAG: cysteine--tRNA ligase [Gammaproteobacteria bacterium]